MPYRIAILYPTSIPWMARCFDGIRQFARDHGDWHLFTTPPSIHGVGEAPLTLRSLKGWKGDGIITATNNIEELAYARSMEIPVVNLGGGLHNGHGVPRVKVDDYQAGRLAAEHFLGRGLVHLAFFGWENYAYSDKRRLGFVDRAGEAGLDCAIMLQKADDERDMTWSSRISAPARWVASLPKPCGVFAVHDFRAQLLMEACQESGIRVPDDVAIVGMDNDDVICEHSIPTLSSVSRCSVQVGWEAASLLDRLIRGEPAPTEDLLIAPTRVIARQSTDMHYCADALVAEAIGYMSKRLKDDLGIVDIAEHLGISRRKLEMRFSNALGTSPKDFLSRLRLKRAKALLETDPTVGVQAIVHQCGFRTNQTFYATWKRVTGSSFSRPSASPERAR